MIEGDWTAAWCRTDTKMQKTTGRTLHAARALVIAAVAVLALGACEGDSSTATTSAPAPTPIASTAPATPAAAVLIPNLTQDAALTLYLDQDFACTVIPASHPSWIRHRCTKTAGSAFASVDIEGPGTGVVDLKASTIGMPQTIVEAIMGDTASLPFDGANADQSAQWVSASLLKGGATTVIGGVQLKLIYVPPIASVALKAAT